MKKTRKGNILLLSSDETLQRVLYLYFSRKYYNVFCPQNAKELEQVKKNNAISFAILDDDSKIDSNISLCNSLLEFDNEIVIYFICQNTETKHKVETANPLFFTILKPFAMRNLLSKMTSTANKLKDEENKITTFNIGNYKFNLRTSTLTFKGEEPNTEQHLTKKECQILQILAQNTGKMVSKHRLLMNIWKKDTYQTSRSMDVYMTRLRHYLSSDTNISIENTHSLGYCLNVKE